MVDQQEEREVSRLTSPLSLVLLALAAVLAVLAVALPVIQLTRDEAIATVNLSPAATTQALDGVTLPTGYLTATGDDEVTVNLVVTQTPDGAPVSAVAKIMTQLGTSVWLIGLAVICFLLARVLADIAVGRAFERDQARRFVFIAIAILICSVGADTINYLQASLLVGAIGSPASIAVSAYYSPIPVVLAAVSFVLAGAFRSGRRIQQDTEGLI